MEKIKYIIEKPPYIYINNKIKIKNTFKKYIEDILLEQLTTYKGRIDAIKKIYGYKKLTPIYINEQICFIPLNSLKDYEQVYINIYQVKYFKKINYQTEVKFLDNTEIIINKLYNNIYNNYKRGLIIKS